MFRAITWTEGEMNEVVEFATWEEFEGYRQGFSDGANCYGCGHAGVYILDDLPEVEGSNDKMDKKIAEAIRQHLLNKEVSE